MRLRLDPDLIAWFSDQAWIWGPISAALRVFVEAHGRAAGRAA